MSPRACLIHTDLTALRLIDRDETSTWRFTPPGDMREDSIALVQERVKESAAWVSERIEGRQLDLGCLDVDETRCVWLRAPSAEAPVLAASFQTASEDWGDLIPTGTLEALRTHESRVNGTPSSLLDRLNRPIGAAGEDAVADPVMHVPDTIARLLLDMLDKRGIRCDRVVTLWHAMARAWSADDADAPEDGEPSLRAVLLLDEQAQRAVWSWARGDALVVGGHTTLPQTPADPQQGAGAIGAALIGRLSIDWLSWASQLSAMPSEIVIIGPAAIGDGCARAVGERWPRIRPELETENDPVVSTIRRAADRWEETRCESSSRCLVALTQRSTRATRRRYRWLSAALLLLAAGLAVLGFRMRDASAELVSRARAERTGANAQADALGIPGVTQSRSRKLALTSHLKSLEQGPKLELPDPPRPVFEELGLALQTIEPFKDDGDLLTISIDSGTSSQILVEIADIRRKTDLQIALEDLDSRLVWSKPARAMQPTRLQMVGQW